jgi:hypothetical protein
MFSAFKGVFKPIERLQRFLRCVAHVSPVSPPCVRDSPQELCAPRIPTEWVEAFCIFRVGNYQPIIIEKTPPLFCLSILAFSPVDEVLPPSCRAYFYDVSIAG